MKPPREAEIITGWASYRFGGAVYKARPTGFGNADAEDSEHERWCFDTVEAALLKYTKSIHGQDEMRKFLKCIYWDFEEIKGMAFAALLVKELVLFVRVLRVVAEEFPQARSDESVAV